MSADDFYERVLTTIRWGLNKRPSDAKRFNDFVKGPYMEAGSQPRPLNPKQDKELRALAIELMNSGEDVWEFLARIICYGGVSKPQFDLETAWEYDEDIDILKSHPRHEFSHPTEIVADILQQANVYEKGEYPIYYDLGSFAVGKNETSRAGSLILTNKRIICIGDLNPDGNRFYYEDLPQRPYLSTIDYISLDKIEDMKLHGKNIELRYPTRYYKTHKLRLYLPAVWIDLPKFARLQSGNKVWVRIYAISNRDAPKDYNEKRTKELYRRIEELRGAVL